MKKSALVVTSVLVCAVAFAQEAKPRYDTARLDPILRMAANPRMAEKIGLTDDQKAKIAELGKSNKDAQKQAREKTKAAMERQAALLQAVPVDEAAVMATVDEVFDLRKEMAKAQLRRLIAVKTILTPEQIEKGLEVIRARQEEMRGRMQSRGEARRPSRPPRGPKAGSAKADKGADAVAPADTAAPVAPAK